jgi:diguanylate cyclase (GGDEF)-like protein
MLLLGGGIYYGVNAAVDRAVALDAEQKARGWADYFIRTTPNLDGLLRTGTLDESQLAVVKTAETVGDVFRFKLFDRSGGLVLVSDEAAYNSEPVATREHSLNAEKVAATGIANISLSDGTGKPNRPPLYVEAYVPVFGRDGSISAIVEVYIDQTSTAALFRGTFAQLSIVLALVASVAFGLPTLAFILRARQARESKQRIEFLAHHDPLTGLLNRSTFNERLEAQLRLRPTAGKLAVGFFDVDNFKAINDGHGHGAGDEILKHVARSISGCLGPGDLAARAGGDEFTVIFVGRSEGYAEETIKRIVSAVREPIAVQQKMIAGRVSGGLHIVEGPNESLVDVVHKADVALYQAKLDGGNSYRLFSTQMESDLKVRAELEDTIRDALAWELFEVYYQPLLNTKSLQCAGFEALLRLPDGKGGFVPPTIFIPVAEAMGLITEIGAWVLATATSTAASWPSHLFVSVNLSVRQFQSGELVGTVQRALESSGLEGKRLELEVTESMLMENTEQIAAQLSDLRKLGVSIAMDDFGTGYSSLSYLWQFGFDKLKIDRSFVTALEVHTQQARDILDTIIMLGHKLDMSVTAEGIESQLQADVLSELACDHFQGFLYGKPTPASDIAAFLLTNAIEVSENTRPQGARAVA